MTTELLSALFTQGFGCAALVKGALGQRPRISFGFV